MARQSFVKISSTKFNGNLSSGSRVVPCMQTVGRTGALQGCERCYRRGKLHIWNDFRENEYIRNHFRKVMFCL
jgi:hypothetical protein